MHALLGGLAPDAWCPVRRTHMAHLVMRRVSVPMRPPATHSGAPATACQDGKELTVMNPALMGKYCKSKNIYH